MMLFAFWIHLKHFLKGLVDINNPANQTYKDISGRESIKIWFLFNEAQMNVLLNKKKKKRFNAFIQNNFALSS